MAGMLFLLHHSASDSVPAVLQNSGYFLLRPWFFFPLRKQFPSTTHSLELDFLFLVLSSFFLIFNKYF